LIGALLALAVSLAMPGAVWAQPERQADFDIPAQPLADALAAFSKQAGVQLSHDGVDLAGRRSAAVSGHHTVDEALELLLAGSGLAYRRTGADAVAVVMPAATAAAPHARSRAEAPAATLGDIVVTATKRSESQRKLPETVNVLKGKDLEDIGAREMEDFLKYVPGISLQEGDTNGSRTVSIRGIGPQPQANTTANSTVGVLIDNVAMGDPYQSYLVPDLDPFDLNDLEVLKGPQGTLFGASALNGALRYVLNQPLLGEWEAKGFADWMHIQGGGSGPTFGGAVNLPVGSTLALRAVDVVQEIPGLYRDVNANGKDIRNADNGYKRMYRLMGLWQPTDRFSLNAFYLKQANHRNDLSIANNLDGSFTRTDTPGPTTSTQKFSVASLDLRYRFDWATLISETAQNTKLQDLDGDASPSFESLAVQGIQTLRQIQLTSSRSLSQELRLVSAPGPSPWVWIAGAYYSRYKATSDHDILLANTPALGTLLGLLGLPPNPVVTDQGVSLEDTLYDPLKARESALFGELTRKLGPVAITLGGRYYRETLATDARLSGLLSGSGSAAGFGGAQSMKSEGFNPKASITWQLTPDLLWYANASHGFQFGGLNLPSPIPSDNTFPTTFKPSTIWSYETGLRTDAFRKTLQFDLAGFLLNWKDMQIPQNTADGLTAYTANVGRARSKGVESALRWLTPLKGLMLVNSMSYIHAKVAAPFTTADGTVLPVGSDLPAAPRLQTATSLVYNTRIGDLRTGAALTYSHQGHSISNLIRQQSVRIYGYGSLDFNYNLSFPEVFLAPAFTVNATNLTNQHALIGGGYDLIGNTQEGELVNYLRPRTVALRISGHF
jgi:outer membrane receptor protein involved in Fe transport